MNTITLQLTDKELTQLGIELLLLDIKYKKLSQGDGTDTFITMMNENRALVKKVRGQLLDYRLAKQSA